MKTRKRCPKPSRLLLPAGILALAFLCTGCVTTSKEIAAKPVTIPQPYEFSVQREPVPEGSVWQRDSRFSELFVNPKARRIGDIVTIKVVETSSAKNSATTGTDRSSTVSGQVKSFFNLENKYLNPGDKFSPFSSLNGGLDSGFEGSGSTTRSGDLSAHITARVVEVLPNGNMVVSGTREIKINNESQYITLSGIVRPRDISSENVVLSTYISDARITYSGVGIVNDRQRPGWIGRILDKTWPF